MVYTIQDVEQQLSWKVIDGRHDQEVKDDITK